MAVLEHVASRPTGTFGLSELARDLGMTKSTCLSIVQTLQEGGWLLQHPTRRTYGPGPTLVATGVAAMERFPDPARVRPLMESFAAEHGRPVVAMCVSDEQLVVLARAGLTDPLHGLTRLGVQMRFEPPFGLALTAWYPRERFEEWLRSSSEPLSDRDASALSEAAAVAHERGFVVGTDLPEDHEMGSVLSQQRLHDSGVDSAVLSRYATEGRRIGYHSLELDPDATYRANHVSAPVPDGGAPVLALAVPLAGEILTGSELELLGRGLVQAAAGSRTIASSASVPGRPVPTPLEKP